MGDVRQDLPARRMRTSLAPARSARTRHPRRAARIRGARPSRPSQRPRGAHRGASGSRMGRARFGTPRSTARRRASAHAWRRASSSPRRSPAMSPGNAFPIGCAESKSSAMSRPPARVILVAASTASSRLRENLDNFQTITPSESPHSTRSTDVQARARRPGCSGHVELLDDLAQLEPLRCREPLDRVALHLRADEAGPASPPRDADPDVPVEAHAVSIVRFTSDSESSWRRQSSARGWRSSSSTTAR